jgi:hypothetical protein
MDDTLLQQRDRDILLHVARYRLTTVEALHRLYLPDRGVEAAKSVLKRLNGSFLRSRPLFARRRYYQLSSVSTRLLGEPDEASQPFGTHALPTRYAVLQYCCMSHGPERRRMTRDEFANSFPELRSIPYGDYCIDIDRRVSRLARIAVDLGGDYLRFLRKLREYLDRDSRVRGLRELIEQDAFVLVILTAEETKRDAIVEAIQRDPLPGLLRVETVPDLINFPRRPVS